MREIEKQLAAELQSASAQLRAASADIEKRAASDAYHRALQRFTDFAARGIIPDGFESL